MRGDVLGFAISMVAWLVLITIEFVLAQKLTRYRTDIPPGSRFWEGRHLFFSQLNVSSPQNYTSAGRPKLRMLMAVSSSRLLALFVAFVFFVRAFVLVG